MANKSNHIKSISELPALDSSSGDLNVIVETIQGSRLKHKYDPELNCFKLSNILTEGSVFPFDFGFIPSTLGDDGDPLDVLLLIEEGAFTGCLIQAKLIGAITAEVTEKDKTERNDRFIAVAKESERYRLIRSLKDLGSVQLQQIEHFFISYSEMEGKRFKVKQRINAKNALKLIQKQLTTSQL